MKPQVSVRIKDSTENRLDISNRKVPVPPAKLEFGSVDTMYPISFDDGKTIIFIPDKSKEQEIRKRYELMVANRFVNFRKKLKG